MKLHTIQYLSSETFKVFPSTWCYCVFPFLLNINSSRSTTLPPFINKYQQKQLILLNKLVLQVGIDFTQQKKSFCIQCIQSHNLALVNILKLELFSIFFSFQNKCMYSIISFRYIFRCNYYDKRRWEAFRAINPSNNIDCEQYCHKSSFF